MAAARLGSQEPTFSVVGDYHHSFGHEAVRMFGRWGVRFYPCQEDELTLFLARDRHNRYACRTICISKPRQNGKSFGVRFYAIFCAAVEGKHVLFTAHRGKTVRKMFKFIRAFVLKTPALAKKLLPGADGIYKAAGAEGVYFANGGLIEFATRTDGGGRGETYDVIIFDEAQELTDEQYDAIVPTTIASESGDPQKIYLGTPPGPTCQGTVFQGMHDKAHEGGSEGIWWLEWSVEDIPDMGDVLAVLELVYQTNPGMGYRIREDVMLDVIRTATSPDGFAREFLGWWSPKAGKIHPALDVAAWKALATDEPDLDPERIAYGVRFSVDGQWVALAAAAQTGKVTHLELLEVRPVAEGLAWLSEWLGDRVDTACSAGIDGKAGTQALMERMDDAPPDYLMPLPAAQAGMPASMLADAIADRSVTWFGSQAQVLESVETSKRRRIGRDGAWGFEGENAAPVEACAMALWALRTTRRDPSVTGKVYF